MVRWQQMAKEERVVRGRGLATSARSAVFLVLLACSSGPMPTSPIDPDDPSDDCGLDAGCDCVDNDDDSCASKPVTRKDAGPAKPDNMRKDTGPITTERPVSTDAGLVEADEDAEVGPGVVVAEPDDEASHIFDQAVVHTFDVELDPADLRRADADPSAEVYVPARFSFEGQTYEVGYRYKGSLGAFFPPCTNFLTGQKAGKCSIKVSFNWKDPTGLFFGLKKLLFHSMNADPSMMRERLGYSLFREMGVPTARASHAVLRINGKAEIYALVEELDGRFTRSRFTEGGKGNLYKEIWPIHDDPQAYAKALETNEDQDASVDRIQRFAKAAKQGPDAMADWMDLDVTHSYMAVDRVIMNDDGAFHFYCFANAIGNNPKPPGNHNFYVYEAKKSDRLWILPWDLDMCMNEADGPAHLRVDWQSTPNATECAVCEGGLSSGSPPPACDPVIKNFQAWQTDYQAKIDQFIAGPFSKAAVDKKISAWKQQIVAAGFPVQEAAINTLSQILDRARTNRGFKY